MKNRSLLRWKVTGTNVHIPPSLRRNAEEKIKEPLEKLGGTVRSADLVFVDCRPGTAPSLCIARINVRMRGRSSLFLAQPAYDFYDALNRLADRLSIAVNRRMGRFMRREPRLHSFSV